MRRVAWCVKPQHLASSCQRFEGLKSKGLLYTKYESNSSQNVGSYLSMMWCNIKEDLNLQQHHCKNSNLMATCLCHFSALL